MKNTKSHPNQSIKEAPQTHFLSVSRLSEFLLQNDTKEIINARNLYHIVFLKKGQIQIKIGESNWNILPYTMYFLAPGQVSQVIDYKENTEGFHIEFDTDYFLLCLKHQVQLCFYPFFQITQYPLLKLTKTQWAQFEQLVQKIDFEYHNKESWNDDLLTKLYLNVLLIEIERLYDLNQASNQNEVSRKRLITAKFKELVEKNFMTLRKVSEYAKALFISSTYLNDTIREVTGQSASQVIQDRVILEAKAKLVQTEATVNEIAYALYFEDTSYFCRFFKKHTGASPQAYRMGGHF